MILIGVKRSVMLVAQSLSPVPPLPNRQPLLPMLADVNGNMWARSVVSNLIPGPGSAGADVSGRPPDPTTGIDPAVPFGQDVIAYQYVYDPVTNRWKGQTAGAASAQFVRQEFTRPNNVLAYAAGDIIGTAAAGAFQLALTGSSLLTDLLLNDLVALPVTPLQFDLYLWNGAPSFLAIGDHNVFTPNAADMRTLLAVVSFTSLINPPINSGAITTYQAANLGHALVLGASNLYYSMVARNAYVPTANEIFSLGVKVIPPG